MWLISLKAHCSGPHTPTCTLCHMTLTYAIVPVTAQATLTGSVAALPFKQGVADTFSCYIVTCAVVACTTRRDEICQVCTRGKGRGRRKKGYFLSGCPSMQNGICGPYCVCTSGWIDGLFAVRSTVPWKTLAVASCKTSTVQAGRAVNRRGCGCSIRGCG